MSKNWFYALWVAIPLSFAAYMAWNEWTFQSALVDKALLGNKYAIQIMVKCEKPEKNQRIIEEALKGNEYALEMLGIIEKSGFNTSAL